MKKSSTLQIVCGSLFALVAAEVDLRVNGRPPAGTGATVALMLSATGGRLGSSLLSP